MKNEWFGDIHDFRKYGLLRFLSSTKHFPRIMVAWMLTPPISDDPCGKYRNFVNQPGLWSQCDPELFAILKEFNSKSGKRCVNAFALGILSNPSFGSFGDNDDCYLSLRREEYFRKLKGCDGNLIFLDADNGLEVASMTEKKKPQYILYQEVADLYSAGKSVLIYQHRAIGQSFEKQIGEKLPHLPQCPTIIFRGGNVSYILLCRTSLQAEKIRQAFSAKNYPEKFLKMQEIR